MPQLTVTIATRTPSKLVCSGFQRNRKGNYNFVPRLLPSATKLRRLCFYRYVSIHGGGLLRGGLLPGGGLLRGCLVRGRGLLPGGCLVPRGAWSGGGGAAWSSGGRGGFPACTEADPPEREGYCCGRYASYWNAFLFSINLVISRYQSKI